MRGGEHANAWGAGLTHTAGLNWDERVRLVHERAQAVYRTNPDWATFFREMLGANGLVRQLFPSKTDLAEFEETPEYRAVHQLVGRLRARQSDPQRDKEPTHMITVRIPKSLHEWLVDEARKSGTSLNKLCISKLLRIVQDDDDLAAEDDTP